MITVFRSDKGDCLLLRSVGGETVLIDGGMPTSFKKWVRPVLEGLSPRRLDVVYVSHIDQDHIGGVLELFRWRTKGAKGAKPPTVGQLWHNGFSGQGSEHGGGARRILKTSARVLSGSSVPKHRALAEESSGVALSIGEAEELIRRAKRISLNRPAGGGLMKVPEDSKGRPIRVGALRVRVIGPFAEDLDNLQVDWERWLSANKAKLKELDKLAGLSRGASSGKNAAALFKALAKARQGFALSGGASGDRKKVTVPNLASLMLLVESEGESMLLTGDGHADDVLRGLERVSAVKKGGNLHVNVLKVQHHASRYGVTDEFCRRITADHYVFCGNGKHGNPHPEAVTRLADGRAAARRTPFTFHFNSSSGASDAVKAHMKRLEALAKRLESRHTGMSSRFLDGKAHSFDLSVL
ncbi:MAG: ComEC/Rec2 family competence protein [Myxococcaceae bacterium]